MSQLGILPGDSEILQYLDLDLRIVPFLIWKDSRWDTSTSVRESQNSWVDAAFIIFERDSLVKTQVKLMQRKQGFEAHPSD